LLEIVLRTSWIDISQSWHHDKKFDAKIHKDMSLVSMTNTKNHHNRCSDCRPAD